MIDDFHDYDLIVRLMVMFMNYGDDFCANDLRVMNSRS